MGSVLSRCLQARPANRFPRATLLSEALQNLLRSLPAGPDLRSVMAGYDHDRKSRDRSARAHGVDQTTATCLTQQQNPSERTSGGSRASAISARQTNLPPEVESFVGREELLAQLLTQLAPGRITTLVGTGGAGKTRLALRFAIHELSVWLPFGGVWFCDLSSARTSDDLVARVAQVLGVVISDLKGNEQDAAQKRIGWAIAGRGPLLLVLDNFEQIEESAREILESWTDLAPQLSMLVTSRQALRSPRERVLQVEPLSTAEAVQLFELRAVSSSADFLLSKSTLPTVTEIVDRLDCIPLAIELAAARCSLLSPDQILSRLSERFSLLSNRAGRQRTLKETIQWSWDLLDECEQEALWQCTAFQGSFRIEAAETVLDLERHEDPPWTLDVLQSLRERSLLAVRRRRDHPQELRFVLLESIREFAELKGSSYPGHDGLEERHAAATLEFAEERLRRWETFGDFSALKELRLEEDNLLAVAEKRLHRAPGEAARAATVAAVTLQDTRRPTELIAILDPCIRACRDAEKPDSSLSRLLVTTVRQTMNLRSIEQNLTLLDEATELAEKASDIRTIIKGLFSRIEHLNAWNRPSEARTALLKVERYTERLADRTLEPALTRSQALVAAYEDIEKSKQLHQKAIHLWEAIGQHRELANELNYLAILAAQSGDTQQGVLLFRRAIENCAELGLTRKKVLLLANLGLAEAVVGDFKSARKSLSNAIQECLQSRLDHAPGYGLSNPHRTGTRQPKLERGSPTLKPFLCLGC